MSTFGKKFSLFFFFFFFFFEQILIRLRWREEDHSHSISLPTEIHLTILAKREVINRFFGAIAVGKKCTFATETILQEKKVLKYNVVFFLFPVTKQQKKIR